MRGRTFFCAIASAVLASALATGSATGKNEAPEIFPLSQVKRGQKGYGLTTIQGTTPERFEFEVIGVNRNFLPKMDIILVKSDDPKLQMTGFWQGMSGSPLFIDGKLVCAFSYGFRFNKVPIGGCTPIHYMQEEGFRARRHIRSTRTSVGIPLLGPKKRIAPAHATSMREWLRLVPNGDVGAALTRDRYQPWITGSPFPHAKPRTETLGGMEPAALPLALSGFSSSTVEHLTELLGDFPLQPMQAGGTGSPNQGPRGFTPGAAIAVQLIRGDMSAASTGTVSLVQGNGVLAFGHPMFHAGEIYAPVAAAEIHAVIPSAMTAFVVASPLRELGALVQDRQSTIAADTSFEVRMIPLRIRVRTRDGSTVTKNRSSNEFAVEVLDNKFFTPMFAAIATMNATSLYLPDQDDVTLRIHSKVVLKGVEPLRFVDHVFSEGGARGGVGATRGLRALVPLLNNPFAPITVDSIDVDIEAQYQSNVGDIVGIRLATAALPPGKKAHVDVEMRQYDGKNIVQRVPFEVPRELAGSIVKLEVSSGDQAAPDVAPPENVEDLIFAVRSLLPGTVFAVTLHTAEEGAAINGKIIKDLPESMADKLKNAAQTDTASIYQPISRSTFPAKRVITGSASMLVRVAEAKTN